MQLQDLLTRALEVRALYSQYEQAKMGKQWSRAELVAGFVGDVGDLIKLTMAKDGFRHIDNVDIKLRHELADCLWALLVIADAYDVKDLEQTFLSTADDLETKIRKYLKKSGK